MLGTTDLHGNVYNWDYFKNAEFDDAAHNDIGVAKVKTVIDRERAGARRPGARPRRRRHHPGHAAGLLLRQGRSRSAATSIHPMARAMNLDRLRRRRARQPRVQLRHPAAAYLRVPAELPAPRRERRRPGDQAAGVPAVRHQADQGRPRPGPQGRHPRPDQPRHRHLGQGQRRGQDGVPRPRRAGQEVRARAQGQGLRRRGHLSAHSGADTSSSYGDALPYPENAATLVAEQVAGVDAILVGHAHVDIPMREVANERDRARRSCSASRCSGASGWRGLRHRRSSGTATGGASTTITSTTLPTNTVDGRPGRRGRRPGAARHRRRLRELRRRHLGRSHVGDAARSSRTCRSSTSSTTCRR